MYAKMLDVQNHRNLTAVQFGSADRNTLEYISLDAAIKDQKIEVREVSSAGSVNTLLVLNHSDSLIFMMDGDILTGAKQNRVLNTSVLLAPQSKTEIPVSCVEQGRWRFTSEKFQGTGYTAPAYMRSAKAAKVADNLRSNLLFQADQGAVWDGVMLFQSAAKTSSPTKSLTDVFEKSARQLEEFLGHFRIHDDANGIAFFINKRLISQDLFHRTDIYQAYFPKLVRSVGMEAFHMHKAGVQVGDAEARYRVAEFFDTIDEQKFEEYPGVGVGVERRFSSSEMTGFELVYQGHLIHMTGLQLTKRSRAA